VIGLVISLPLAVWFCSSASNPSTNVSTVFVRSVLIVVLTQPPLAGGGVLVSIA